MSVIRSASDAVTTADSASQTSSLSVTAADSVSTSDAVSATRSVLGSADDSVSVTDDAQLTKSISRLLEDTVSISDSGSQARDGDVFLTANDSLAIFDSVRALRRAHRGHIHASNSRTNVGSSLSSTRTVGSRNSANKVLSEVS